MHLLRTTAVTATALAAVLTTPLTANAIVNDTPAASATFDGPVLAMARYGSTIFVAGNFSHASDSRGTFRRGNLAAVSATTGKVLRWHPTANAKVEAIAAYRGRVYVGGSFTRLNGRTAVRVGKLTVRSGAVDRAFRGAANGSVLAIAVTRTRIYLGGKFTVSRGASRPHLASYNRQTNRLTSWRPRGNGSIRAIRTAHRLVWVGGSFTSINGNAADSRVAAIRPVAGTVSRTFSTSIPYPVRDIRVTRSRVYAAAAGPGGHLYASSTSGRALWHRTFDGDVDTIGLLNNLIYVGGHWNKVCGTDQVSPTNGDCATAAAVAPRLAAFRGSGARTTWAPDADSSLGVVAMVPVSNTLAVGGGFGTFKNGTIRHPAFALFRE